jgi:RNA polymerase sigma factor (sigma-70 family)
MPPRPEDGPPSFPSTRWSRILPREGSRDLEALARDYARPIRAYLAAKFRLRDEDTCDLAQDAFAWILETRFFERADPAKGRFRGFLKKALARFAIDHLRKQGAAKRGGGRVHEPIDPASDRADPKSPTPDQALDDAWRRDLLERARQSLEEELSAGGKRTYYLLFRDYFLDEAEDADHEALARRYAISKTDVSNWLDHAKKRYRARLRALVLDTVSGADELGEEMRWLMSGRGAGRE